LLYVVNPSGCNHAGITDDECLARMEVAGVSANQLQGPGTKHELRRNEFAKLNTDGF
jgi:hypothetical protein